LEVLTTFPNASPGASRCPTPRLKPGRWRSRGAPCCADLTQLPSAMSALALAFAKCGKC
jgi:hypothetical protein